MQRTIKNVVKCQYFNILFLQSYVVRHSNVLGQQGITTTIKCAAQSGALKPLQHHSNIERKVLRGHLNRAPTMPRDDISNSVFRDHRFEYFATLGNCFSVFGRTGVIFIGRPRGCTPLSLTHLCPPLRSTFAVRETGSLGIMGAPRVPPLNSSETIVL